MKGQTKVGTYVGTGAAIDLQIGFVPDFVFIVNQTDGNLVNMWFNGMPAGTSVDINTAVVPNPDNGVTVLTGTRGGKSAGVTIGTDASLSGKTYYYFAVANQ